MPILAKHIDCTGCAACAAACPFDALHMESDEEGFLRPVVDEDACRECGACTEACPVVTYPDLSRLAKPDIYAIRASDEVRAKASSGGVFPLLAKWMLARGGMVVGAVIDYSDSLRVKHVASDDPAIIAEMSSSKYVQSEIAESVYIDVKAALKDGRGVLFSGCPCQVAGAYAYLGDTDRYEGRLYTMDFFCHGVPSPAIYEKYLRETYGERLGDITRFDFRDKSVFGWSTCINAYFADGTEEHVHMDDDPYYQLFLPCAMQRPSCSACMFSSIPRRADMSVGDFWGCEHHDVALNDGKGTSFALANSEAGREMLDAIRGDIPYLDENIPLSAILPVNPTPMHPFASHPGREHVFKFYKEFPMGKLANHALHGKYDVGIVSKWYASDIEALATWALARLAEEDGHDAIVIEKPGYVMRDERLYDDSRACRRLVKDNCFVTGRRGVSWQEMEHNETCGRFLFLTGDDDGSGENGHGVRFENRARKDEMEYFSGRFVSPTRKKMMLVGGDRAMWMPLLAVGREAYEHLVVDARRRAGDKEGNGNDSGDNGALDPITALVAGILKGGTDDAVEHGNGYSGKDAMPVLISLACGRPFSYTGDNEALLELLAEIGISGYGSNVTDGGIGIGANGDWETVRGNMEALCSAYKSHLFSFLDAPRPEGGYDNDALFAESVMREALESHRKADALRKRIEELERKIEEVSADANGNASDSMFSKGMRYLRENGIKETTRKVGEKLRKR